MVKTIKGLAVVVAMLAAAGHADAAVPAVIGVAAESPADRGTLTFSSTQSNETEQPVSATGGAGVIRFEGSVQTGNPCFTVKGAHSERGKRIVLTVTATPGEGMCTQVITYNNYTGQISDLAAGTYDFQIVHVMGRESQTVFNEKVTVS